VDGQRVDIGCSSVSTPSMLSKSAHICVGCTLVASFANECRCVCPQYPSSWKQTNFELSTYVSNCNTWVLLYVE
jgi:hypothetical protein